MNSKKVIEKLFKVAENHQKIINKLAQAMVEAQPPAQPMGGSSASWEDVTGDLLPKIQEAAQAAGTKAQYGVETASVGSQSGVLKAHLTYPKGQGDDYYKVSAKLKEILKGKSLKTSDGKDTPPVTEFDFVGVSA